MPVMKPALSLRNLTPSSTAASSSVLTVPGTVLDGQMEQGQGPTGAAVVNDQDVAVMVLPAASVAPLTLTVYVVPAASAADGVKVAVRVAALYAVVPATAAPAAVLRPMTTVEAVTSSLKPARTAVPVDTPVALTSGARV